MSSSSVWSVAARHRHDQAGIDAAFGFYVASVPYDAHRITASAYTANGQRRWTAAFPTHDQASPKPSRTARRNKAVRPG